MVNGVTFNFDMMGCNQKCIEFVYEQQRKCHLTYQFSIDLDFITANELWLFTIFVSPYKHMRHSSIIGTKYQVQGKSDGQVADHLH